MMNHHVLRSLVAAAGLALACLTPVAFADDKPAAVASESAASERVTKLQPGDKAPALKVESFLKGSAISEFKADHVYVVEFWATWCQPCVRAFPHLSELQKKYDGKVTFVGVNIWEARGNAEYTDETLTKVTKFIEKQGEKMSYTVAYDGAAKAMTNSYMEAASQNGIPAAFIVDGTGTVAWIGHPGTMDDALESVVKGTWDVTKARDSFVKEMEAEVKQQRVMKELEPVLKKLNPLMQEQKFAEALPLLKEAAAKAAGTPMGGNIAMTALNVQWSELKDAEGANAYAKELANGAFKDDAEMLNGLAWTMVDPDGKIQTPNADLAIEIAERANTLSESKNAAHLDTLARAYFVKGNKAKAVEVQTKAVSLATGEMKEDLEKALKEYAGQ